MSWFIRHSLIYHILEHQFQKENTKVVGWVGQMMIVPLVLFCGTLFTVTMWMDFQYTI